MSEQAACSEAKKQKSLWCELGLHCFHYLPLDDPRRNILVDSDWYHGPHIDRVPKYAKYVCCHCGKLRHSD